MLWITKYRHNKIVDQYKEYINDLKEALFRKEKMEEIVELLAKKTIGYDGSITAMQGHFADAELRLPAHVAVYVDDYFGGKVIKQEATKVVILESDGVVSYAFTAQSPDKNRTYKLVQK